jgi:hypothetical protein
MATSLLFVSSAEVCVEPGQGALGAVAVVGWFGEVVAFVFVDDQSGFYA